MSSSFPFSPLNAQEIRARLHTLILGHRLELHTQVGSTNDLAKQAGRRGEPEGLVILAEEQVAGRGRLGRTWTAPPGCCVLCSVLLRPRFSPQQAFYLTIAASLAIYRATNNLFQPTHSDNSHKISIKWPNDVLVNGRKIAGILCETEFTGDGWRFAVIGFGINANLDPEQLGDLQATATSLSAELGQPIDRIALLCCVLAELEAIYLSLQNGQFGPIYNQWASALDTTGRRVSVRDGKSTIEGYALRVDPDGALVLRVDGGVERRVLAGDVS